MNASPRSWVLSALIVWFLTSALPAYAQTQEVVSLSFSVTDSAHRVPLSGARIALFGPVVLIGFSNAVGQVQFDNAPAGRYRARISKQDFVSQTTELFTVTDGQGLHFDVALGNKTLKSIGSIKARLLGIDGAAISAASPLRQLGSSLDDVLAYLPGVQTNYRNGTLRTDLSINGHDPRATGLSIDGVPAVGNGARFNSDLFGSLSVSDEPQFGFLGGAVNLRTVDPALAHSSSVTIQDGFGHRSATTALDRGTIGSVGYSVLHSERNVAGGLLDETFLDTSGLDYRHAGVSRSVGNVGKLRTTLGRNQTLTAVALDARYSEDLVCVTQTGALPCGYGPGNRTYGDLRRVQLDDAILSGSTTIRITAFATQERNITDFSRRYAGGRPAPSGSADALVSRGATLDIHFPPNLHALALNGYVIGRNQTLSSIAGDGDALAGSTSSRFVLSDSFKVAAGMTAHVTSGFAHTAALSPANAVFGAALNYVPNALDRYTVDASFGEVPMTDESAGLVTAPSALTFDCNAKSASGYGPGDVSSHPTSTTIRAGWNRRTSSYRADLHLYRQTESGTPLAVPLSAAALPLALFPGGKAYFDAASLAYSRQPGCSPAVLSPSDIYLSVPLAASRKYQGINASLALARSPRLAAQVSYSVQSAIIASRDARIDNPYSFVLSGSQLPNVPLHAASAVVSWKPITEGPTFVAGGRYTSSNNVNNLPAYATFSAAVDMKLRRGRLQLAVNNLTNVYGADLATPQNAVSLARRGAAPLRTIAIPLTPRTVSLTYTMSGGAPLPAGVAASVDQDVSTEITLATTAFGQPPGAGPFQLDKTNPNCFINESRVAARILQRLDDAAARAAQVRRTPGPEATLSLGATEDVKLAYRRVGDSYAITVTATTVLALRALASCGYIHDGTRDQEEALGLYLPARGEKVDFVYMPRVGLYTPLFLRGASGTPPGTQTQHFTALPPKPPVAPLKLRSADSCTAAIRPAAEAYLTALAAFEKSPPGAVSFVPEGWTFKRHAAVGESWIETSTADAALRSAVIECASVAGGTQRELVAAGAAFAPFPALNYDGRFGLYMQLP